MYQCACALAAAPATSILIIAFVFDDAVIAAIAIMVAPVILYIAATLLYFTLVSADIYYYNTELEENQQNEKPSGDLDADVELFSHVSEAQQCPICLEHADAPAALACGHAFHAGCVTRWLSRSVRSTCPICRAPVKRSRKNKETESPPELVF
jgi:hypothetical protein